MHIATQGKQEPAVIEAMAKAEYERCHHDDTFDDLKRRAKFSKEDRGLLVDWYAAARASHGVAAHPGETSGPD